MPNYTESFLKAIDTDNYFPDVAFDTLERTIDQALNKLSDGVRRIFTKHFSTGDSVETIARDENIEKTAVESIIKHSLIELRKKMKRILKKRKS